LQVCRILDWKNMKLLLVVRFALIGWLFVSGLARAELNVEITRGAGKQVPVAVVPFGWEGEGAAPPIDVAAVIAADLQRSGRFSPIDINKMLQRPTSGVDVNFADWSILGVEALVIGRVTQTADNVYSIQFQLFDVFGREQLVGYRMPSSRGTMRVGAHRAADMIYEKLTGIPGVFGTQVTYVTATGNGRDRLYRLIVADADGENENTIMESTDPIMSPADGLRMSPLRAACPRYSYRRCAREVAYRYQNERVLTGHRRFHPMAASWYSRSVAPTAISTFTLWTLPAGR
jgi:TolB protein